MRNAIRIVAVGAAIAAGASALAQDRAAVRVENFTHERWLGGHAAEAAPPAVLARLRADATLALYAQAFTFESDSRRWCVAHAGWTHAAPAAARPRVPAELAFGAASGPPSLPFEGEDGCIGRALKRSVQQLFSDDHWDADLQSTTLAPGRRKSEPPDPTRTQSFTSGMSTAGRRAIVQWLPDWASEALDYRRFEWRAAYDVVDGDEGERICMAYIGLGARAADSRTVKVPAALIVRSRLLSQDERAQADTDAGCFDPLFKRAIADITPQSPFMQSLWDHWSAVAESDQPPPDRKRIAAAVQAWERRQVADARDGDRDTAPAEPSTRLLPAASPEPRCHVEVQVEQRPFNENVCDYNEFGPVNCRNITTRWEEFRREVNVCR